MKIIVDNKIPYIHEAVEQIADEVVYLPGSGFTAGDVRDADALVIRTRTRCNRELLEGSKEDRTERAQIKAAGESCSVGQVGTAFHNQNKAESRRKTLCDAPW